LSQAEKTWHAIDAIVADEALEAASYGLMEAGALGTESRETNNHGGQVTGYFDRPVTLAEVNASLLEALRIYSLAPTSLIDLRLREVADHDWLGEWKKSWQPVLVGTRFIIAPPWSEVAAAADRVIIRIEPGMAFGTGTHETTRLCLRAIEKHFSGGSLLDIGTGTGILAIAAAKLRPDARVEACDTDAEAVEIARENARLNRVAERIKFRVGSVDNQTRSADLVCANLTAPVIAEVLPFLLGARCGRLILSGILDSQVEMIQSRLRELGESSFECDQEGEWIAVVV
jgi:ribosomal protein L11 methyltransferase